MTAAARETTWKWVTGGALTITAFFAAGWIGHVNGYEDSIDDLEKGAAAQAVMISTMSKQIDDIHRMIFDGD